MNQVHTAWRSRSRRGNPGEACRAANGNDGRPLLIVAVNALPAGDTVPSRPKWHSRQIIVTPQMLGLHTAAECGQRAEKLGLTPLPALPHRQEYWRLDVLLTWARANGFDCLPMLGRCRAHPPKGRPFAIRAL